LSSPQQAAHYYGVISKDPQILRVFEFLVDHKKTDLQPTFDIVIGYHYPEVINALQVTAKESLELAKRIVSLGLGIEEYHEQVIRCPFCTSEYTTVRFHCPFCNSTKLMKEVLLEHPGDGTIAPLSSFKKGGVDSIVCPVCKKALVKEGKDYRTVGVWYGCLSCGKQFDTPKNTYLCLSCSKEFTTQELVISSVNKITIDKAILEDFSKRHFVLRPLLNAILEVGYEPASPGTMTGKSGYQHTFSAVGTDKDGKVYAFEIAIGNPQVEESAILNMFAKVLDTQPAKSYIICMPSLNINGKKIAGVYGIEVIEGDSMAEVSKSLKEAIAGKKAAGSEAPAGAKGEGKQ
jgi:DNA-directed RNA polymerase subunit RPC12/RpoP